MDRSPVTTSSWSVHRSAMGRAARGALCVLAITPLLRWAVIAHTVHPGQPWRRACPQCATRFGPSRNIRALSPCARCSLCQLRLGPPPWTLELVTAGSAIALAISGMTGLQLVAYGWWAVLGVVLSFVDLAVQRLPARLSYAAVAGFLTLLGIDAVVEDSWQGWVRSASGALIAAFVLAVCALAMPRLVHWGDVRYALAIGAAAAFISWLGIYAAAFVWTLIAAVVGGGLVMIRRATLTTHLPQGPFLFGGTVVTIVLLSA
jgi:leader peptidase (prepilin peptidase) / N-methyltransferase